MNKSEGPFAGIFSFRYVKGTKALLGFTQFEFTCIIELDCVMSDAAYEFYIKVWNEIERLAIPFTFHWGKILDLNSSRIRNMYGHNIVDDWLKARNKLMRDAASMQVFTNDLMVQWGLDTILMNA